MESFWPALMARDVEAVRSHLAADPAAASRHIDRAPGHPGGAMPLNLVAMLRLDLTRGVWADVTGTAEVTRLLLNAGAAVDGPDGEPETPLMTAGSYGDAAVASVLVEAGADLARLAAPDSGGVPGGTALRHATVFGMTRVVDVLMAAGARAEGLPDAAAAGDLGDHDLTAAAPEELVLALNMAADHQRLDVIDALLAAGTPIDAENERWGRQALRTAAEGGRSRAVAHLLARGADPAHRGGPDGETALDACRREAPAHEDADHPGVERLLLAALA